MLMTVCFCCLNTVDVDQMVLHNSYEVYHRDCLEYIINLRNKRKSFEKDFVDVSDCLVIDNSEEPFNLIYKKDVDYDKPIGKIIDLASDEKVLELYNNAKKQEFIKNTLLGTDFPADISTNFSSDFATDIAGNFVKINKNYANENELKQT